LDAILPRLLQLLQLNIGRTYKKKRVSVFRQESERKKNNKIWEELMTAFLERLQSIG
jgi:hypothetical protein